MTAAWCSADPGRQVPQPGVRGGEAADDPVHHHGERVGQEFVAAGEIVPHRADGQLRFICNLPQGGPLETIRGDDLKTASTTSWRRITASTNLGTGLF